MGQPPSAHGGVIPLDPAALRLPTAGGHPLPEAVRRHLERVLGAEFGDVRIHQGPHALSIGALAFTVGSDIHFAPGQYLPETTRGRQLLGHELAHVLQQRAGRVRNPSGSGLAVIQDHTLEAEAERMGLRAAQMIPRPRATARPSGADRGTGPRPGGQGPGGRIAQPMKRPHKDFYGYREERWIEGTIHDPHERKEKTKKTEVEYKRKKRRIEKEKAEVPEEPPHFPPPVLSKPPPYFELPDWGKKGKEWDRVGGGTWVKVTLGPAAGDTVNRGSKPQTGKCSSVEELNDKKVLGVLWVKGHLLNEDLGGPGTSKNLTPLTHDANMAMKRFDSTLKRAVGWCELRSQKREDEYFYGVEVEVQATGKAYPGIQAPDPRFYVRRELRCSMRYVRRSRVGNTAAIGPHDRTDPPPVPGPQELANASGNYPCV